MVVVPAGDAPDRLASTVMTRAGAQGNDYQVLGNGYQALRAEIRGDFAE
jgi:hypothetical protein